LSENSLTEAYENKYKLLIQNILDVIVEINQNGIISYISPQSFEVIGYKAEELLESSIYEFIHSDDLISYRTAFNKLIKSKKNLSLEYRLRHKEGFFIYLSMNGRIVDKDGEKNFVGILRDISQNKKAERRFLNAEDLLNKITDQSFLGFIILQEFKIKYYNKEFSKKVGYSSEEIAKWKSREFFRLIHPDDIENSLL
jgi:PAS domain S-box-containing protein